MKLNIESMIKEYNEGQSINAIARRYKTYPTTVRRILIKNEVTLRHDSTKKGDVIVENGEKLVAWAKAQGRLVTKSELAEVIGTKRLQPSYFIRHPELGQYVKNYTQADLVDYAKQLYDWLQAHNIPYKPGDRTRLKVSVDALLLGDYTDIALQNEIKPVGVSTKRHHDKMKAKLVRADELGIHILFLNEEMFNDLDNTLGPMLNELKHRRDD